MKFNCGPTASERKTAALAAARLKYETACKWHRTFLWWPLRFGSKECRWLEFVERRLAHVIPYSKGKEEPYNDFSEWFFDYHLRWEYRTYEQALEQEA